MTRRYAPSDFGVNVMREFMLSGPMSSFSAKTHKTDDDRVPVRRLLRSRLERVNLQSGGKRRIQILTVDARLTASFFPISQRARPRDQPRFPKSRAGLARPEPPAVRPPQLQPP